MEAKPESTSTNSTNAVPAGMVAKEIDAHGQVAGSSQRPSALVADDDPIALKLLSRLMTSFGYRVTATSNGHEALSILEKEDSPQFAILDRTMDGADGLEICRRIRALPRSRYTYIILVTARDKMSDRLDGLSAGADDYLTKPFDPRELQARLETARRICLQKALDESEMRFRQAIESSGVGMSLADIEGNWIQVNQAFADFFGYTKEELFARTFRDVTYPEDMPKTMAMVKRLVAGECKNFQLEKRYFHKSGKVIWGLLTMSLVKGHEGVPTQVVAQVQDITNNKIAEHRLQESEALFRAIAENADELIAVTDPDGNILYTSPAYEKHLGYLFDDLYGQSIFEQLYPEDHEVVRRRMKYAIDTGSSNNVQVRLRHKNGTWRTVDSHVGIVRNAEGVIEKQVVTSRIIDAWIAAQEVLQEREEQLQLILNSTAEAIYGIDREGNCTFGNKAFLEMLGYESIDELLGMNIHQKVHHSYQDGSRYPVEECHIYQAMERGEGVHVEDEVLWRANGTCFPVEYWSHPVLKDGRIVGGVVTFIDITHRKMVDSRLREAHNESELVINSVPTILIGLDTSGHITQWNLAAIQTFGLSADVRWKSLLDCGIHWLDKDMDKQAALWLQERSRRRVDNIRYQKDGETRLLGFTITPVEFSNENSSAVLIIGADTTERKALEQQLQQAQKLEAIGQLAAGIAHEINTPIQFVGDNTTFVKDSWESISLLIAEAAKVREQATAGTVTGDALARFDEVWQDANFDFLHTEVPRAIDQSLEGIRRVANIVRAMKEFSHPGTEEKKTIDINHAIETTITVARNEWRYVAQVETKFSQDLPFVPCHAGELNQAILNLIINAAHAIGDVSGANPEKKGVIAITTRRDGDWVEISIQDNGSGIPEAIRSRIFEPFFTTKDVGRGTGQGLTLAHASVVKKHGGKLWFESEVGKGTTFFIRLPLQNVVAPQQTQ